MTLYSYVQGIINDMNIGDLVTIDKPDKLFAFRKFLSEISANEFKKFTTRVKDDKLHIMRVNYFSVAEKLQAND